MDGLEELGVNVGPAAELFCPNVGVAVTAGAVEANVKEGAAVAALGCTGAPNKLDGA